MPVRRRDAAATFAPSCSVTLNTAVAVKVNGHKVGFYAGQGGPVVHLDGQVLDPTRIGTADLGTGATLAAYRRGYELDLPDGTKVWAITAGSNGFNILVKPSSALLASGVGLMASVPSTSSLRVPALPDGSVLAAATDRHDLHHQLYEVLAPAWRVTDATTLFDYEAGRTAASYGVAGFPPESVPTSTADLDPATFGTARAACAGVTDPDLADQCAFDTAVTGDTSYVTLYAASDQLQSVGTSTLDLEPGATPAPATSQTPAASQTPRPPGTGTASGVNLVEDQLGGATHPALGPDGTVYVEVAEPAQGLDVTKALLAIDGPTGRVRQRATPEWFGRLAFVAGSLWVDGFKAPDNGCRVSRLDPTSLAVIATVTAVCGNNDETLIVPFEDALWFVDVTGADAAGRGGHLRRIDPATNTVDQGAGGSIEMPFVSPFMGALGSSEYLAPTSTGIIAGDAQNGMYRLRAGSTSFEPIATLGAFYHFYPAGDGIWTQLEAGTSSEPEGTAGFYDGGTSPSQTLTVTGSVVGADDYAVYSSFGPNDDQPDGLFANAVDGSVAAGSIATSAIVPISTGTYPLTYRDPTLPLLTGDGVVVKLWTAPSPTGQGMTLYEQSIPVP